MTQALDQSILELLLASRDDENTLQLPLADRTFGFHAQQAYEKLLKALIAAHGERYSFIHDVVSLADRARELGENLPDVLRDAATLTEFAGIWRYQTPEPIEPASRAQILANVATLRAYTHGRVRMLRKTFDWTRFPGLPTVD